MRTLSMRAAVVDEGVQGLVRRQAILAGAQVVEEHPAAATPLPPRWVFTKYSSHQDLKRG